ncbi:MAG: hypothetical protein COV48_02640 [Elusimicrobia bacterium CG11_big_fil_rev_8_21_14_0_20_64_6]|nr:MAG: hypothetical protein COV48_02640 [Elusimicrobia bacterium CG11_big_fil_rev_8_21_14_0_20_64_6]
MKRLSLSVLAFAAFTAASARAELSLVNVSWQRAQVAGARVVSWEDAEKLTDGPPKINTRLRARLTLKNRGPVAAEGILLRYSLTGRVSPVAEDKAEGVWGIPFSVDEKRVPKVGPNKRLDVYLTTSPALELYLAKLGRAGWWPDRLKIQVMIEPHRGAVPSPALESVLEVAQ